MTTDTPIKFAEVRLDFSLVDGPEGNRLIEIRIERGYTAPDGSWTVTDFVTGEEAEDGYRLVVYAHALLASLGVMPPGTTEASAGASSVLH